MTITDKEWTCDIKSKGCQTDAVVTFVCKVEGVQVSGCRPCYDTWRTLAGTSELIAQHCPRCYRAPARVPAAVRGAVPLVRGSDPLTGVIADAIDAAMFREGVLGDVRKKVLVRLANEEPWLNSPTVQKAAAS
jgi:hypothetical protein